MRATDSNVGKSGKGCGGLGATYGRNPFRDLVMMALVLVALSAASGHVAADALNPQRQAELLNLLIHDCGSCHGLTLQGGLGPSLTPEALRGKPAPFLAATILYGRPGTPMPPWRPFLTDQEVAWLVEKLQTGVTP